MYLVEVVDTEKFIGIDRSQESYNRERNATKDSMSPVKTKAKSKEKRPRWFSKDPS